MKHKHIQHTKTEIVNGMIFERQQYLLNLGIKIAQMIDLSALHYGYEWPDEDIKDFYGMTEKYLTEYFNGRLTKEDIDQQLSDLKETVGIDILAPVTIVADRREK